MTNENQQRDYRERDADLARLRGLRPMDDDFMRCIFRDNIPLAQFVLRILTGKPDLIINDLNTQKDMKRLVGARSIVLDVYASDADCNKIPKANLSMAMERTYSMSTALITVNPRLGD